MSETNKMNMNIVNANIKLQDENRLLKNDNEILKRRINIAKEYLKSKTKKFKVFDLERDIQDIIDMLEGTYVYEKQKNK